MMDTDNYGLLTIRLTVCCYTTNKTAEEMLSVDSNRQIFELAGFLA